MCGVGGLGTRGQWGARGLWVRHAGSVAAPARSGGGLVQWWVGWLFMLGLVECYTFDHSTSPLSLIKRIKRQNSSQWSLHGGISL
jgi:hypothetical protein